MDDATVKAADRGVHAAVLASLPRSSPRRLDRLLAGRDPAEVLEEVKRGDVAASVADGEVRALWKEHSRGIDLAAIAERLEALDAWVTTSASAQHPPAIVADIDPAPVLFRRGRVADPAAPAVAIVGTRRCTPTGRSVAMELGAGLGLGRCHCGVGPRLGDRRGRPSGRSGRRRGTGGGCGGQRP